MHSNFLYVLTNFTTLCNSANEQPPPDSEVLLATTTALRNFKQSLGPQEKGWALLETAGGKRFE